jgi:transposase
MISNHFAATTSIKRTSIQS